MARCIVLLGPPGSGKSTVGAALGLLGYRWRDWEPELTARWGNLESFIANKERALSEHQANLAALVHDEGRPAVLETTGISDAAFLDRLTAECSLFVVRLEIALEESMRRIQDRDGGRHLSDDAERNRATWQAFQELVLPHREVDLLIDTATVSPAEAAALIDRTFSLHPE